MVRCSGVGGGGGVLPFFFVKSKGEEGMEDGERDDDDTEGMDWEFLAFKTEGCQARDLSKLVKRCAGLGGGGGFIFSS